MSKISNAKIREEAINLVKALDEIRWSKKSDLALNYCDEIKNFPEDIILTHCICYISDRQMPFNKIWTYGGYVYSKLLNDIKHSNIDSFNSTFKKYIKINSEAKNKEKDKNKDNYKNNDNDKNKQKYIITSDYSGGNACLDKEGIKEKVVFTSRYYTTDIRQIYFILYILKEKHELSLFKFFYDMGIKEIENDTEKLKHIIYLIYVLVYENAGTGELNDIKKIYCSKDKKQLFNSMIKRILSHLEDYKKNKTGIVDDFFESKCKSDIKFNGLKRLWCSVRDYFKSPDFSVYFKAGLKNYNININNSAYIEIFKYIELPGDVWNNNKKFRNCILNNDNDDTTPISYILREEYDNENNKHQLQLEWYPEKFDVSFDFAMRMCANNKCKYCILNKRHINKDITKICHQIKNKFCLLAMVYCGYEYECPGINECVFVKYNVLDIK